MYIQVMKTTGRVYSVEKSIEHVFKLIEKAMRKNSVKGLRLMKRIKDKPVKAHLQPLLKILELTPQYVAATRGSGLTSRFLNNYLILEDSRETYLGNIVSKIDRKYSIAAIYHGVANNYLYLVSLGRKIHLTRTPVGDLLIEKIGLNSEKITFNTILTYLFSGLLVPSRTSLIFLLTKYLESKDPTLVADNLRRGLFTGEIVNYRKLVLSTLLEIYETGDLCKYIPDPVKCRKYITPTHIAFKLAELFSKVIDFETYRKILLYVSGNRGFTTEEFFKPIFKDVHIDEHEIEVLISSNVILRRIEKSINIIRENYEKVNEELLKNTML